MLNGQSGNLLSN
jgi:hypothetical protein